MDAEAKQGIHVLNNSAITIDGITFIGSPDPRTSHYGEKIRPSSTADQAAVLTKQARALAAVACKQKNNVVVLAHAPLVGRQVIQNGCNKAVTALDGHEHQESGPNTVTLQDGSTGYQYTGPSAGGASTKEETTDSNPLSQLTIGTLNHDAYVEIASINHKTSQLVAITTFKFTPDHQISVTQKFVDNYYNFSLPNGRRVTAQMPVNQPTADAAKRHGH
jgi:hypothetical protein